MGINRDQMVAELEKYCDTMETCGISSCGISSKENECPLFKFMEHKSESCDFSTLDYDDLNSAYNIMLVAKDMIAVRGVANNACINKPDMVSHPSHYNQGNVECIDAMAAATVNKRGIEAICVSNVIKYLFRYETKNGLEDVKKAAWYLNRLIKELENK